MHQKCDDAVGWCSASRGTSNADGGSSRKDWDEKGAGASGSRKRPSGTSKRSMDVLVEDGGGKGVPERRTVGYAVAMVVRVISVSDSLGATVHRNGLYSNQPTRSS